MGQSGVGKSTLLNYILKLKRNKKAKAALGFPQTVETKLYFNENFPYLQIIDTQGIELNQQFGENKIFDDIEKIIDTHQDDYNNYVQCIWYCFSDNYLSSEIEVIKKLKAKLIPIIIVNNYSRSLDGIEKRKNELKELNLPFIDVRAKSFQNEIIGKKFEKYGDRELLELTIDVSKKENNLKIIEEIKNKIFQKVIHIFKEINAEKKKLSINEVVKSFITYTNLLDNEKFIDFMFKLIKIILIKFIDSNNEIKNWKDIDGMIRANELIEYTNEYNNFCENVINEQINNNFDSDINKIAIGFLDEQAKIEISNNLNIKIEDKKDKEGFIQIIKKFLKKKFSYLCQKYIIYTLSMMFVRKYVRLMKI